MPFQLYPCKHYDEKQTLSVLGNTIVLLYPQKRKSLFLKKH